MKWYNKQKPEESEQKLPQLSIIPGITVIAILLAAVFAVLFIFLWRSDMTVIYFGGIFSPSETSQKMEGSAGSIVLPLDEGETFGEEHRLSPDFSALSEDPAGIVSLLRSVRPAECYEQTLSVSYNEGEAVTVTVYRDGDRYRVESPERLVICDGETVYLRQSVEDIGVYEHRWSVKESAFSPQHDLGVPFLADIIADVENSEVPPSMTFDEKDKVILLSGIQKDGMVNAVSVTFETGMVLYVSSSTTDGNHLYRCFNTAYTIDPAFPGETFAVPAP